LEDLDLPGDVRPHSLSGAPYRFLAANRRLCGRQQGATGENRVATFLGHPDHSARPHCYVLHDARTGARDWEGKGAADILRPDARARSLTNDSQRLNRSKQRKMFSPSLFPPLAPVQILKTTPMKTIRNKFALLAIVIAGLTTTYAQDPLLSWNDGPAKQAIVDFVKATTETGGANFVAPEERIATFDQDGTLWVEHPMYSQVMY